MSNLLLAVDIGNTRAKFGLFEPTADSGYSIVANTAIRLAETVAPVDYLGDWLTGYGTNVAKALVSGSNPPVVDRFVRAAPDAIPECRCRVTPLRWRPWRPVCPAR